MERGIAKPRLYPATKDGTVEGEPVFLSREELAAKRINQGPYTFACQMLQDPKADETQGFKSEWLRHAAVPHRGQNLVILVDPANAKKKSSDYTSAWCLGLGADRNIYVHDMVRDRLSLTQRADLLMHWHRKWQPMAVGYEHYGMQADIEHIRDRQERENYRFDITALGGAMPKVDRIRRLIPWFEQGRIFLPPSLAKTNYENRSVDLVRAFIDEEYLAFPVAPHDDMLDALARFLDEDMPLTWPAPLAYEPEDELELAGRDSNTGY
jgi:predicted phage terminase large subunit-like protein